MAASGLATSPSATSAAAGAGAGAAGAAAGAAAEAAASFNVCSYDAQKSSTPFLADSISTGSSFGLNPVSIRSTSLRPSVTRLLLSSTSPSELPPLVFASSTTGPWSPSSVLVLSVFSGLPSGLVSDIFYE